MKYSSYQQCSQLCVSTIHVSCVYAATRRVVRAWAGGPPVPGHVCGGSNVGQSFIIDYRAGWPVSAYGAVQLPVQLCVWAALPAACDVALWATAAQCCDLDNLSDGGGRRNSR